MADSNAVGKFVYVDGKIASYDKGSGGVKTYLNGVLVTDEVGPIPTEALSSKPSAENMFADIAGGAAPTPAPNATPAPTPATPPEPTPTAQYVMTERAQGMTRADLLTSGKGWTDELLISQGLMLPPGGVKPSFS